MTNFTSDILSNILHNTWEKQHKIKNQHCSRVDASKIRQQIETNKSPFLHCWFWILYYWKSPKNLESEVPYLWRILSNPYYRNKPFFNFFKCMAVIKLIIFNEIVKSLTFNIWHVFQFLFQRCLWDPQILTFFFKFTFHTASHFFGNWGCTTIHKVLLG